MDNLRLSLNEGPPREEKGHVRYGGVGGKVPALIFLLELLSEIRLTKHMDSALLISMIAGFATTIVGMLGLFYATLRTAAMTRRESRADFERLDSKIEEQGNRLDGKIEEQGNRLDAKIEEQGNRLDAKIEEQGNRLDAKIEEQGNRLDAKIEEQGNRLHTKIDTHVARLETRMNERAARFDSKIDDLRTELRAEMKSGFAQVHSDYRDVRHRLDRLTDSLALRGLQLLEPEEG